MLVPKGDVYNNGDNNNIEPETAPLFLHFFFILRNKKDEVNEVDEWEELLVTSCPLADYLHGKIYYSSSLFLFCM